MTYLMLQMWLCLLIAFLLGLLVGWWLGRRSLLSRIDQLEEDRRRKLDQCRDENAACRKDLEACRKDLAKQAQAPTSSAVPLMSPVEADEAPAKDDLTRIEGIGPKIEGLLNAKGIGTWAQLAETEVPVLQSVLDEAGPRYRIHDPATWPRQASLAAAGAWKELEELQDRLQGGREEAVVEPDDLKKVEGIGPKIEGLLNAKDVFTWAQLAKTEVSFLQSVLDEAGPRYRIHDPETWPEQARLAAEGAWEELEELQDRLKGGREA